MTPSRKNEITLLVLTVVIFLGGLVVALCLGGCSNLDDYDRSYSLRYADGDQSVAAGVTLHPRAPYANNLRVPTPRSGPTPSLDWSNPDFYPDLAK